MRASIAAFLALAACTAPVVPSESTEDDRPTETRPDVTSETREAVTVRSDAGHSATADAGTGAHIVVDASQGATPDKWTAPPVGQSDTTDDAGSTTNGNTDAATVTQDAGVVMRCQLFPLATGTVYTMGCASPFPTGPSPATKIEWQDRSAPYDPLKGYPWVQSCKLTYGTACRVWFQGGLYTAGSTL